MSANKESENWYERLSPGERRALETYAIHWSYKAVANALGLSVRTIEHQVASARQKMEVATTAEAMALFSERSALLKGTTGVTPKKAAAAEPSNGPTPSQDVSKSQLKIWPIAVVALLVIAISAIAFRTLNHTAPSLEAELTEIDAKLAYIHQVELVGPLTGEQERKRCDLVVRLSQLGWQEMWTRREASVGQTMSHVKSDILRAFDWALVNAPKEAVTIVGDGHRVFNRSDLHGDWPGMLDKAINNSRLHNKDFAEMGRAYVGVAVDRVLQKNPGAGYDAAKKAVALFTKLGDGYKWDLANAVRHQGMCVVDVDEVKKRNRMRELYDVALKLFEADGDADRRGHAHIYLSRAQTGHEDGNDEEASECMRSALDALREWHAISNAELIRDSLNEVLVPLRQTAKLKGQFVQDLKTALSTEADYWSQRDDQGRRLACLAACVDLDNRMNDERAIAVDLGLILSTNDWAIDHASSGKLRGCYVHQCHLSGIDPLPNFSKVQPGWEKDWAAGSGLRGGALVAFLYSLITTN